MYKGSAEQTVIHSPIFNLKTVTSTLVMPAQPGKFFRVLHAWIDGVSRSGTGTGFEISLGLNATNYDNLCDEQTINVDAGYREEIVLLNNSAGILNLNMNSALYADITVASDYDAHTGRVWVSGILF